MILRNAVNVSGLYKEHPTCSRYCYQSSPLRSRFFFWNVTQHSTAWHPQTRLRRRPLSKRNGRSLVVLNAINGATLEKEARPLQSERKSEEKLFRKKKEEILQWQSIVFERQQSSVSSPEKESNPFFKRGKASFVRRSQSLITLPNIHATQRKYKGIPRNTLTRAWSVGKWTEKGLPSIFVP